MGELQKELERYAASCRRTPATLDAAGLHEGLARGVMLSISRTWAKSAQRHAVGRRAYYLSAEFLVGRAIHNNLLATGLWEEARQAMETAGQDPSRLEEIPDAGLGNGGLGRLAACFLDSAATLGLPLDGYGIRYRYGIFRQRLEGGFQQEEPDDWTREGDPWSVRRAEEAVTVSFGDGDVRAVPYDTPVIGWGGRHISTLRLWQCEPLVSFDFNLFNAQQYDRSARDKNRAEDISRVLYPNDSGRAGKLLRLRQQYFFCSASMQDMLRAFETAHGTDWEQLPHYVSIQLNDTHPVIAVPELIRLLTQRGVRFRVALSVAAGVFNYTNHTIMQEALERWEMPLVRRVCPAVARIIRRLAARQQAELTAAGVSQEQWGELMLLQGDTVHMAYLACWCSTHINGVAALHTDILRQRVLRAWEEQYPGKILNMTNGVTQRRWLALCNPALTAQLTALLGDRSFLTDLPRLRELEGYARDEAVLRRFIADKRENKCRLAAYMAARDGLPLDPDTLLDVQIKRLHEYKRQLLNILCILELYFEIQEGALTDFPPITFLFGAKAAPGYYRAKAVIRLIHAVGELIARDEAASRVLKVVFVPNYDVSYAEHIVAAADISQQISTAGTEASGTGNMKLMLNGAVTLGTYDGANIEIVQEAGEENNYIFGARVEELDAVRDTYRARDIYEQDPRVRRCLDALVDGTLDDGGTGMFRELYNSLLDGAHWHRPDHYFLLVDFDDYLATRKRAAADYRDDRLGFAAKQWRNLCAAGKFSADRTVAEYAKEIWKIKGRGTKAK